MCRPISIVSDGQGKIYCFPWELRRQIYAGELKKYDPDSHTSVSHYHGFQGEKEDKLNKWEHDFSTGVLTADQINTTDDRTQVEAWLKQVGSDYFYPPAEVAEITSIIGNLHVEGIPLVWANLTEVKGDVWATNCAFPVLTEVKGDVRATNCAFPVLTEVKGDVWATNCAFPVLTEVKGDVRDCKDCQFPVLTEVKGYVWATNCAFPVLTEVKGDVWATNCAFPVLTEVKGDVRATNCAFPVLTEVKGDVRATNCAFPVLDNN